LEKRFSGKWMPAGRNMCLKELPEKNGASEKTVVIW